jgi:tRNA 5-methylaminomethyl-2-thiouridine biosynthesis bifunctional protein
MVLRSEQFDDVYFSAQDGLAETRHVFLGGNDITTLFKQGGEYIIAETGFGTGLNFLATWTEFEAHAHENARLHFISVEKYPLSKQEIATALEPWQAELSHYVERYLKLYPIRVPGPHCIHVSPRVTLTIWLGDIADILPEWRDFQVDAWYLDGFTPAKNPEMWTAELYETMARLSHQQTRFATFTAAGHVKRGLEAAGFTVEKSQGYGRKRDMLRGIYTKGEKKSARKPKAIAIIGGGLAGCAMAYTAMQAGLKAIIYEAGDTLASGASGGRLGMVNPKLTAQPTAQSDYYTAAYANALRVLSQFNDIDFIQEGSRHLCLDSDKARRFEGYISNLGWHADHIHRDGEDLIYPDAPSVSPYKLCHALAQGREIRLNNPVIDISKVNEDIVILANGYAYNDVMDEKIPIHSVRGQVSHIKPQANITQNICFGGYITPQVSDGFHVLGASFQPWETDISVTTQDHQDNLKRYNQATNGDLSEDEIVGGWAALRTSSKDRFPIVGHVKDNIYVSTAHGSHGIISSIMAAQIIMAQLTGQPVPASREVIGALSPHRFALRQARKDQAHATG